MNEQEYKKWREDAFYALNLQYSDAECTAVLFWFDEMSGGREEGLIGEDSVKALHVLWNSCDNFDIYNSMMSRLFIYAPLILKEKQMYDYYLRSHNMDNLSR